MHIHIHIPLSLSIVAPCESFLLEIIHVCGRFPRSYDSMDLPDQHSWVNNSSGGQFWDLSIHSGHLWTSLDQSVWFCYVLPHCWLSMVEHGWPSWLIHVPLVSPGQLARISETTAGVVSRTTTRTISWRSGACLRRKPERDAVADRPTERSSMFEKERRAAGRELCGISEEFKKMKPILDEERR